MHTGKLRVGISRDFLNPDGTRSFDEEAWNILQTASNIDVQFLEQAAAMPVTENDVQQFDVLLIKRNPVSASALDSALSNSKPGARLRLLARNGAGYDHIDVDACNRAGVMVSVTRKAVAHSVASSVLALMLAFSHRLPARDRMTRAGQWSRRWAEHGTALRGRTLGVIGLGNIGLEVFRLSSPWGMRHLGYTPRPDAAKYKGLNIEQTDLATLLRNSDFIALCCPFTDQTRHLINAAAFELMRPNAFLINTARGEIVDEAALVTALKEQRIAGAGIDVFETEPPRQDHPFFSLESVMLGSHNLAFSDELNRAANRATVDAVIAFAAGHTPQDLVNPQVLGHPNFDALVKSPTHL
jgi:D-3-phosphoglycerate dehydrogenase